MCEVDVIAVVLATKGRPDKLRTLLKTIPDNISVYAYAVEDSDVGDNLIDIDYVTFGAKTIIQANNHLISEAFRKDPDVSVVVGCDDITFEEGCFDEIEEALKKDDSKLYGLTCRNMKCKDDAFVCISNKIIKETDGRPYNEQYLHFYADTELGDTYKKLNRFKVIDAGFYNWHPGITGKPDKTHTHNRSKKLQHDMEIYENRNIRNS